MTRLVKENEGTDMDYKKRISKKRKGRDKGVSCSDKKLNRRDTYSGQTDRSRLKRGLRVTVDHRLMKVLLLGDRRVSVQGLASCVLPFRGHKLGDETRRIVLVKPVL